MGGLGPAIFDFQKLACIYNLVVGGCILTLTWVICDIHIITISVMMCLYLGGIACGYLLMEFYQRGILGVLYKIHHFIYLVTRAIGIQINSRPVWIESQLHN